VIAVTQRLKGRPVERRMCAFPDIFGMTDRRSKGTKSNLDSIAHRLTAIALTGFQGHPRSINSISSDRVYATSY